VVKRNTGGKEERVANLLKSKIGQVADRGFQLRARAGVGTYVGTKQWAVRAATAHS
jgi:hypothetical protein